mmetsp:Transcript_26022/g.47577  ORF Transcript_26022/g.47577 Transcript_26022/m.47577 type:complete len:231 (-) Transcript_26022:351-1043(-)
MVTIGVHFENNGAILNSIFLGEGGGSFDGQDIHAIDLQTRDVITTSIEIRALGRTPFGSAHAVMVVLTHKDDGEVPESSDIYSLVLLALIGSTISIHCDGNILLTSVLMSHGKARTKWNLSTNNAMATIKVIPTTVKVHATTDTFGATSRTTKQFGKDFLHRATPGHHMAMITIRGNNTILKSKSRLKAHKNSLLTIVEMAEATDKLGLIHHVTGDFHPSHFIHRDVHLE